MEVVIWMRDREGIHVTLECGGHEASAEDLFEIAVEQKHLHADCENVFSIWLVSPLLGKILILGSRIMNSDFYSNSDCYLAPPA